MLIAKACLAFLVILGTASQAGARAADIPEIGPHLPILIVEKNVNPQNKLVVYTKLDADGRFLADRTNRNRPVLDFYWLMNGRNYKAVHPLIRGEIRNRFSGHWSSSDRATCFTVSVRDLKEVKCDISDPKMEISVRETNGGPTVEVQMNLGPSDGNMRMRLSSIYTEGRAFPPAVHAVTLKGEEIVNGNLTGRKITRRYSAAGRAE